jgi:hypothetical protein
MFLGDDGSDLGDASGFFSTVGDAVKGAGQQAATAGATSLLQTALNKVGGNQPAAAPPPPKPGIPPQVFMIGGAVVGVILLAKLFGGRKRSAPVANPSRRKHRRGRARRRHRRSR